MQIPLHWKFRFTFWYREWHIWKRDKCGGLYCKLRSHAGSDMLPTMTGMQQHNFNPHSRAGSDSSPPFLLLISCYFNPHSHAGSDDTAFFIPVTKPLFQSTLPRREWRFNVGYLGDKFNISIHTPTQGVTFICKIVHTIIHISIHTPTQGVTNRTL